ncbi:SanA/YdcF family protein [Polluticoccus soli]|uniref:SanA/YdcF family protein n=1 Tax=Polluticoccus soli TaxID=3034150 RepID=UPI0023E0EB25|nr:ElyC/SanA/YdcF family protein [Flavipsychrobacter sp. JY13-12]
MKFLKYLVLYTATALVLVFLALEIGLSYAASDRLYSDVKELPRNKTALLLTTSKTDPADGRLLPYYQQRVDAAAELYGTGKVKEILISGANVGEPTVFLVRKDLLAKGVPADRIFMDTCGYNTYESIVRCRMLFASDSVTIVSQRHHSERALYMARHTGLHAIAYAASGDGDEFVPGIILHEFMGRVKMFWRLKADQQPRHLQECPIYK